MAKRLSSHPKVEILYNTTAVEAKGDGRLMKQLVINTKGEQRTLDVNGLFYAVGHEPATALVKGQVEMDAEGYVLTKPGTSYTNVKGLFAAGGMYPRKRFLLTIDVQDKRYRQAITSAGSGCIAARIVPESMTFLTI